LRKSPVDHRDPGLGQALGQRVVTVERDQKSTVYVKTAQVVSDTLVLGLTACGGKHQLQITFVQHRADTANDVGEERVGEQPVPGFGNDQRNGVGTSGHQGTSCVIGAVTELCDRVADGFTGARADLGRAVDDPGHGPTAHSGSLCHHLQGRTLPTVNALGHFWSPFWHSRLLPRVLQQKVRDTEHVLLENPCRGGVPGRGTPPSVPSGPPPRKAGDTRGYRSGKRPVAASSPYHNPLSLITRFCVL